MAIAVALFGLGGIVLTRRQLRLMSVIYLAEDGLHLWRLNTEVMVIHWNEVDAVRSKSRWGDFEVRCERTDKRLRVEHRLIGLDDLRASIESNGAASAARIGYAK
jgi:hypothetical protein